MIMYHIIHVHPTTVLVKANIWNPMWASSDIDVDASAAAFQRFLKNSTKYFERKGGILEDIYPWDSDKWLDYDIMLCSDILNSSVIYKKLIEYAQDTQSYWLIKNNPPKENKNLKEILMDSISKIIDEYEVK